MPAPRAMADRTPAERIIGPFFLRAPLISVGFDRRLQSPNRGKERGEEEREKGGREVNRSGQVEEGGGIRNEGGQRVVVRGRDGKRCQRQREGEKLQGKSLSTGRSNWILHRKLKYSICCLRKRKPIL